MIILITGVSSGFGKAMALRLAKDGHKVYGTVRREVEPLEGVTYLTTDVRDDAGIAAAFAQLMKAEGPWMYSSTMQAWVLEDHWNLIRWRMYKCRWM